MTLLCAAAASAQRAVVPKATFAGGTRSTRIPLDIDNNIIRMKVRVNGSRPLTMIFDTGATVSAIDEHFVKELDLKTTTDRLKGIGTGGNFTGTYIKGVTLAVDGAELDGQPLAAFKMNTPPGFEFDGVIGYDLISKFVIEIDYAGKTMTLRDPASYVYRGTGQIIPLDLRGRKTPLIRTSFSATRRIPLVANLELDTGADNAFLLNSPFVRKHRLARLFRETRTALSCALRQRRSATFSSRTRPSPCHSTRSVPGRRQIMTVHSGAKSCGVLRSSSTTRTFE
jgi:hypothetical protein